MYWTHTTQCSCAPDTASVSGGTVDVGNASVPALCWAGSSLHILEMSPAIHPSILTLLFTCRWYNLISKFIWYSIQNQKLTKYDKSFSSSILLSVS